jgi:hypothetical protein
MTLNINPLERFKGAYHGFKNPQIEQDSNNMIAMKPLMPCMRFIDNSIQQQMKHIIQEVNETQLALAEHDLNHALEETIDILQSCLTALEIYRRHGFAVQETIDQVFIKNNGIGRNYYCIQGNSKGNINLKICDQCNTKACKKKREIMITEENF